ncbi:sensor histidine kinase [Ornithinibacillus californiensis]|uniref:sensor histidine kinase n=1 Tax=Ornithinibacillus californiensis TaxID=161536 RepID=UPI00064DA70D|nr:HAMP domain-containing sensor histidine kinase [Ornithinibacillus californiensis]
MGTKWKSSFMIIFTCITLFFSGVIGLLILAGYGDYYAHKSYFHTDEFKYGEVERFAHYVSLFEFNDLNLDEAKKKITVSQDEIDEHRYRYGNLEEQINSITMQYEPLIQRAMDNDDAAMVNEYEKERDLKIEDITNNFEDDAHVEAKIIKEKEKSLEAFYQEMESNRPEYERLKDSFQYYFTNDTTGKVYTNLDKGKTIDVLNEKNMHFVRDMVVSNGIQIEYETPGMEDVLQMINSYETLEGKIGIPKSLSFSNVFMRANENYKKEQILYWSVVTISILALLLSLIIFKRAKKSREAIDGWSVHITKLPIELRVLLLGTSAILTPSPYFIIGPHYDYYNPVLSMITISITLLIASFFLTITLIQLILILRSIKDWKNFSSEWKKSYTFRGIILLKKFSMKLLERLKEAFLDQTTGTQIILVFGLVFILGLAAVIAVSHPIFMLFYIVVLLGGVGIPLAIIVLNKIGEFNRIVEYTDEIVAGKLSKDIKISGNTVLVKLAENINLLKQGVKTSQKEQAKSERLKTELITNVSHDLRTPLTSIITYTELLKEQKDITDESSAYLEIIDRKSKRLKVLLDDLFEVSKMASGNMELKKEKVDLVQLLQQALGEYDEVIKESNLQFRISHDDPPINAVVDGQKLWRVFDNLIGNILKYSLEHSRVYINLVEENGTALITFKNVSKYELTENSEELFERFKRGDTSRHTEGSGLGLAIVQSIVELHDGSLEIETDGDLFKVTVLLLLEG